MVIPGEKIFINNFHFDISLPNPPITYPKTLYYPLPVDRHYGSKLLCMQIS